MKNTALGLVLVINYGLTKGRLNGQTLDFCFILTTQTLDFYFILTTAKQTLDFYFILTAVHFLYFSVPNYGSLTAQKGFEKNNWNVIR